MFLALLAFVLIAGIAFYQTAQGLFSALMMTILAIVSAAVAFNYYELLAQSVFYNRFSAYADATCLMALFVVTLIVLRIVFDLVVRGNVVFNPWVNRIGGGVLGLIFEQDGGFRQALDTAEGLVVQFEAQHDDDHVHERQQKEEVVPTVSQHDPGLAIDGPA